jgi:hypothetical protein
MQSKEARQFLVIWEKTSQSTKREEQQHFRLECAKSMNRFRSRCHCRAEHLSEPRLPVSAANCIRNVVNRTLNSRRDQLGYLTEREASNKLVKFLDERAVHVGTLLRLAFDEVCCAFQLK